MGLAIEVGSLAWALAEGEDEGADWTRQEFAALNALLRENGLPEHREPETLPELQNRCGMMSFPYGCLHHLRRAVAYARQAPEKFAALDRTPDPTEDPLVDRELSVYMSSHVICHSDAEGFYVPIDFPDMLYGDIVGGIVGSSQRVLRELDQVAPLIGVHLAGGHLTDDQADLLNADPEDHPYRVERFVWLAFWEAARLSVEHGTAIRFT